jgi:hypothetical protein
MGVWCRKHLLSKGVFVVNAGSRGKEYFQKSTLFIQQMVRNTWPSGNAARDLGGLCTSLNAIDPTNSPGRDLGNFHNIMWLQWFPMSRCVKSVTQQILRVMWSQNIMWLCWTYDYLTSTLQWLPRLSSGFAHYITCRKHFISQSWGSWIIIQINKWR